MNGTDKDDAIPDARDSSARVLLDLRSELWNSGVVAGEQWAHEEMQRGCAHPLHVESALEDRILIDHAQDVFGGRCRGRPRRFLRGFIHGVAKFWRSHATQAAKNPKPTDVE